MSAPDRANAPALPDTLSPAGSVRASFWRRFRRPSASDAAMLLMLVLLTLSLSVLALWLLSSVAEAAPLSAGDKIQVVVDAGEEFSGKYQIDVQGRIQLPYAGAVPLAGLEPEAAAATISDRLVAAGLFRRSFVRSSVLVLWWAPLDIRISGAVFIPGAHKINLPKVTDRTAGATSDDIPGGGLPERKLSDALRAGGGVTPWADIAHVGIRRNGQVRLYNLWGLMAGETGEDPSMQAGDEVIVPALSEPQSGLARPSVITPPGIKVFISNLISPATSNANATAIGGMMSMAYGSRFSQAVVAANCVGGIGVTSGQRSAVLVRTDRSSGATRNWEAPVENLIREATDANNPLLQEGDAVACYDSGVTTMRDVFRAISEVLNPFVQWKTLR